MWDIDLSDIGELSSSIERLFEKRAVLTKGRPLAGSVLQKIKEGLALEWTYNSNSI